MDSNEYLKQSGRTAADVELNFTTFSSAQAVLHQMVEGVNAGMQADCIKRSLFYKDPKIPERVATNTVVLRNLYEGILLNPNLEIPADKVDLLHAALGLMSEAGEVVEQVVGSIIKNHDVDTVNLEEEAGDICWYLALLLRAIGSSFARVMKKNIDKLFKRYPSKFTAEDAINRDVKEERATLEDTSN